jgi:hypothetical protein
VGPPPSSVLSLFKRSSFSVRTGLRLAACQSVYNAFGNLLQHVFWPVGFRQGPAELDGHQAGPSGKEASAYPLPGPC